MGAIWKDDDIYIGSQFDLLNLRFAPPQGKPNQGDTSEWFGGIEEMVALQKEFQIFKKRRPFSLSVRILNVGGQWNQPLKNKLYQYLNLLPKMQCTVDGRISNQKADSTLVDAMIRNLESSSALPVYFRAHDSRGTKGVIIELAGTARPLFYIDKPYLTVSFPMEPYAPREDARKHRR
jgi:hypothetical protein